MYHHYMLHMTHDNGACVVIADDLIVFVLLLLFKYVGLLGDGPI